MTFRVLLISISLSLFSLLAYANKNKLIHQPKASIVGIIIPLPEESAFLQKHISQQKVQIIDGVTYHTGLINNKHIVFVDSGLGKINSAIIATRLIRDFHPDIILMAGSSGSINSDLKKFDVVIGKQVANVDFGELTKNGVEFKFGKYLNNPQSHTLLPIIFNLDE